MTDGAKLRKYRKRLGWTQEEVGRAVDYSTNSIARMERGEQDVPGSVLQLMAILSKGAGSGE